MGRSVWTSIGGGRGVVTVRLPLRRCSVFGTPGTRHSGPGTTTSRHYSVYFPCFYLVTWKDRGSGLKLSMVGFRLQRRHGVEGSNKTL